MKRNRTTYFRPSLEGLEQRVVPYALTGGEWANTNVSASFMPDGTITDRGAPSNLFADLNGSFATAAWQREYARALQTWASVTPLNFRFVSDSGAAVGTLGSAQGDSRFGDIRFGGYPRSDGYAGYSYYPGGSTLSGDSFLATNVNWRIGTFPDLYSMVLHETGHSLGLAHSSLSTAVMYPTITGVYTGLSPDDIAGIQAVYGARRPDAYDAAAPNDTLATATARSLDSSASATVNADLTTVSDVDCYRVTAPLNGDGTLTVSVDARNLSLLIPKVSVYDTAGNFVATANAGTAYGTVATLNLTGLTPGRTYIIRADGATTDVFSIGAYRLNIRFGTGAAPPPSQPTLTINNRSQAEGNSGTMHFTFTVTLSAASTSTVTVRYATADGTATTSNKDYSAVSGTLTFAPGETQQTITVLVYGDTTVELDETFFVNLGSPSNAVLGDNQGRGTIEDDDLAPASTKTLSKNGGGVVVSPTEEIGDGAELLKLPGRSAPGKPPKA